VELGWRGERWGQQLGVEVGLESLERQDGERDVQPFGFLSWRHQFSP
jgi:hypothetical protein